MDSVARQASDAASIKMSLETKAVKIIGQSIEDQSKNFELELPSPMQVKKKQILNEEHHSKLQEAYFVNTFAFEKKTGRDLQVRHHCSNDSGNGKFLTSKFATFPLPRNILLMKLSSFMTKTGSVASGFQI